MQVPTVFDRVALSAALVHGPVARIVVATVHGSAPREAGAAMLVWADGQSGTIGGGALEFQAVARARKMLADAASTAPVPSPQGARAAPALPTGPHDRGPDAGPTPVLCASPPPCGEGIGAEGAPQAVAVDRIALGPALNQCCGGAVTLWTELWTSVPDGPVIARGPGRMPLAVARTLDRARSRKLGGTGLGLAIVKHIVQAHRGRIDVESTPGQGSMFRIHLPRVNAPEPAIA